MPSPDARDAAHATAWGLLTGGCVLAGIYFGSRHLRDFDPALVPYAGASVFSAFGLGYRYSMWLRRPPTRLYWRRGWQLFFAPSRVAHNVTRLARLFVLNILAQRFIEKRSPLRWTAHAFIFWGCILAAAVTFPLSFGWIHFETAPGSEQLYRAFVFGLHVFTFPLDSVLAPLVFNVLDISAGLVLVGIFFAMWRRGRDRGALAVQQFADDLLPLAMLFAVSVTGIFLTVSTHLMRGVHFVFLSQLHAVTVIFTLLYLPFGKFFHIFQRPAQLGIAFYREAGERGELARCAACGGTFAPRMQVEDLKAVERELGIRYDGVGLATGRGHYQDVCPSCRRKNLALVQDRLWRGERAAASERVGGPGAQPPDRS
ncbi:MAG: MFS transporter [Betaproteobacteria bacterium]